MTITVAAFYKFVAIEDCGALKSAIKAQCVQLGIKGTALIAREGLNAMLSGESRDMEALLAWLMSDPRFADITIKRAGALALPFKRLKVKIKSEIIRLGEPHADPNVRTGARVAPADWNALIHEEGIVVIDTRNAYEVEAGTFEGAIDPKTRSFGEFPRFVADNLDPERHPKVAMFCTGGIRCEKASALLLARGFHEVYQLDGGILAYLAQVPADESLWRGECFVFDDRAAVGHEPEDD